ncbi:MAG TPA: phage virion morphogenesis protein [Stellaceae bacterium]|jgi:phage virion morphogenesis protein
MAQVSIKVTVKDQGVSDAIARVTAVDRNLIPPLFKNWGEYQLKATRARFLAARGPDGKPWTPLNRVYAAGKRGPGILRESGQLMGSLVYQVTANQLAWGSPKVYAAIHQKGGTIVPRSADALVFRLGNETVFARKVTIPARPYLGVSAEDREVMGQMADDFLAAVWTGRP